MSIGLVEHFRWFLEYDIWATGRTLDSIDSIPEARRSSPQAMRAIQIMAHVQIARHVWHSRITGAAYDMPKDWFPSWKREQIRTESNRLDGAWSGVVASLAPDGGEREVRYSSSEGRRFVSTLHEILTHVFNHSTYHRGQVARMVVEAGGTRADTDAILMTRREL